MAGASGRAASREENRWGTVVRSFNEEEWNLVLTSFNVFTNDYPGSDHVPQGVLYLAQAEFHLAKDKELNDATKQPWTFRDAADLLRSHFYQAGPLADQYLSWTAEAEYAGGNYQDAADLYARLARDYDTMRAEALYREAECYYEVKDLPRVVQKLGAPDGAFQQLVKTNASGEPVAKALFLLTETELALTNYAAAANALQQLPLQPADSDLEWKRQYLMVRTASEAGRPQEAWQSSTNLLTAAKGNAPEMTRSRMLLAQINLQLDQAPEAISNYEAVLNSDTNMDHQRDALLSIVEVNVKSGLLDEARAELDQFIKRYPDEQGSYYSLLQGELRLRQYFKSPAAAAGRDTNLSLAESSFQAVIQNTNSDIQGRAWLYLGWCWWAGGKIAESGSAFSNAVQLLPPGEDRAQALFKLGDAEYGQKEYPEAISHYNRVIEEGGAYAKVTNNLFEPALYQIVRASTAPGNLDLAAATNAVTRILAWFPNRLLGESSELLLGQAEDRASRAGEARATFADFIARAPQSSLRPDVELAIARTYERQYEWTNAVAQYTNWISTWSDHPSLPLAEFSLATAQFQAGDATNAFSGLTNFVKKYPTNELAAQAHYWIGNYYFAQNDWTPAEHSFQDAYHATNGATPELKFEAEMMAGKAAWARQSSDANVYFTDLGNDTNFSLEMRFEARFALADILTVSADASHLDPVKQAIEIYADIANRATNKLAIAARGRMADCHLKLAAENPTNYLAASNCYEMVINATNVDLGFRCLAEFGMAQMFEGVARLTTNGSTEWRANMTAAIEHCLNVVNDNILRDGESRDLREVKRCGLEAGRLMQELAPWDPGQWEKALKLYESLDGELDLPAERRALQTQIAAVRQHLPAKDN